MPARLCVCVCTCVSKGCASCGVLFKDTNDRKNTSAQTECKSIHWPRKTRKSKVSKARFTQNQTPRTHTYGAVRQPRTLVSSSAGGTTAWEGGITIYSMAAQNRPAKTSIRFMNGFQNIHQIIM